MIIGALASVAQLAGCSQPVEKAPVCRALHLTASAPAGGYAGELERAQICVKMAARELTRAGGPPATAAGAAITRCAAEEASAIATLRNEGPVWPYQKKRIDEDLSHLAAISAIQARSVGCGRNPGEAADTPYNGQ